MEKTQDEPSVEERFKEIEELILKMEDSSLSLEDSFNLYKEGLLKIKGCQEIVDKVEKQLIMLRNDDENI